VKATEATAGPAESNGSLLPGIWRGSTLISSFVMSKLDYCNVVLADLPSCDLDRLQSVINAAARLTVGAQRHDHITPLLADLQWLRIPQRIQYKLCVLV